MARGGYRKLSPTELRERGLSPKSERYLGPTGDVISKRAYQQTYLLGGKKLEQRAAEYKSGARSYRSIASMKAAESRKVVDVLVKKTGISRKQALARWHFSVKMAEGGMTDRDWQNLDALRDDLPEGAEEVIRRIVSPPTKRKAA